MWGTAGGMLTPGPPEADPANTNPEAPTASPGSTNRTQNLYGGSAT